MKKLILILCVILSPLSSYSADFTVEFVSPELIGTIITHSGRSCPVKTLLADGSSIQKSQYPELYAAYTMGDSQALYGESSSSFTLPNLKGKFLRGAQNGSSGADPEQAARLVSGLLGANLFKVGSMQMDEFKSHTHIQNSHNHLQDPHRHSNDHYSVGATEPTGISFGGRDFVVIAGGSPAAHSNSFNQTVTATNQPSTATNQNSGGVETRPANQSVLYCIYAGR